MIDILKKFEIAQHRLTYLGFDITSTWKAVNQEYLEEIWKGNPPKTIKDIEKILGKGEYIVNHKAGYSQAAAPLHKIKGIHNRKGAPPLKVGTEVIAFWKNKSSQLPQSWRNGMQNFPWKCTLD